MITVRIEVVAADKITNRVLVERSSNGTVEQVLEDAYRWARHAIEPQATP